MHVRRSPVSTGPEPPPPMPKGRRAGEGRTERRKRPRPPWRGGGGGARPSSRRPRPPAVFPGNARLRAQAPSPRGRGRWPTEPRRHVGGRRESKRLTTDPRRLRTRPTGPPRSNRSPSPSLIPPFRPCRRLPPGQPEDLLHRPPEEQSNLEARPMDGRYRPFSMAMTVWWVPPNRAASSSWVSSASATTSFQPSAPCSLPSRIGSERRAPRPPYPILCLYGKCAVYSIAVGSAVMIKHEAHVVSPRSDPAVAQPGGQPEATPPGRA